MKRKTDVSLLLYNKKIPQELIENIINIIQIEELKSSREYHVYNYNNYLKPNLILLNQIRYINKWKVFFHRF